MKHGSNFNVGKFAMLVKKNKVQAFFEDKEALVK